MHQDQQLLQKIQKNLILLQIMMINLIKNMIVYVKNTLNQKMVKEVELSMKAYICKLRIVKWPKNIA